jgi:inosine/xanthosine triphosphate pyrophosphatase family protein
MTAPRITVATTNPAKLQELQRLIGALATVIPLPLAAGDPALAKVVHERGETVEEIAAAKAVDWSRLLASSGFPSLTIASDGGLLIPALGSLWNPLRTRRFAGEQVSDLERSRRLLDLAKHLCGEDRSIWWQEAVAIADQGRLIGTRSASGPSGRLARTIREDLLARSAGFWVPTIWEMPELGVRRLAELTPEERAQLSDHWAALREPLRAMLSDYLGIERPLCGNEA